MSLFQPATNAAGGPFFEDGDYIATLKDVEPAQGKPEYGPSNKWTFWLAPEDSEPDDYIIVEREGVESPGELWQFAGNSMGPKSNGRKWTEALLGRALEEGEAIGLSDILDKSMLVTLVSELNKETAKWKTKIVAAKPYTGKRSKPQYRTAKAAQSTVTEEELASLPF